MIGAVRQRAEKLQPLSSEAFTDKADELRSRVTSAAALAADQVPPTQNPDIVADAFALMTEALRRARGIVYYDVQLQGGLVLAAGAVAEIQTGEGKTITTALPAFLHSLTSRGSHVATTNEYLSQRDCEELEEAFQLLNVSVGRTYQDASPADKQQAYQCDITYGPGYEFGFDFLRDQLTLRSQTDQPLGLRHLQRLAGYQDAEQQCIQRDLAFAVVDEADSVLIDEAATPLILSGIGSGVCTDPMCYVEAARLAEELTVELDVVVDRAAKTVAFTPEGWETIHQRMPPRSSARMARPWAKIVENALRAHWFLQKDVDYVIRDDEIVLVDQNTGRLHAERTWRGGLHQAVEVREGLEPSPEKETQARITRQRYCNLYDGMCGMTGTARGGESEFHEFYNMPVVEIPTHRPCQRITEPGRFFATNEQKIQAMVADVVARRGTGRPVLLGTRTIETSKQLSTELTKARINHTVLNGLQDQTEAQVVSLAGQQNRVTVATNMAGRGTDIRVEPKAKEAGGLHVMAAEFHASQRIDRQLEGRAARQGDPGSCQFFASAEDELIASHAPELAEWIRRRANEQGEVGKDLSEQVRRLQHQMDVQGLYSRRQMVAHDQWVESVQEALARRA